MSREGKNRSQVLWDRIQQVIDGEAMDDVLAALVAGGAIVLIQMGAAATASEGARALAACALGLSPGASVTIAMARDGAVTVDGDDPIDAIIKPRDCAAPLRTEEP